jgi:transketolase
MINPEKIERIKKLAALVRYFILISTTEAGSGHPTSSLSATELMSALLFGGVFKFDVDHPERPNNDRLIFSKGHASPLFYSLWAAAGELSREQLLSYRRFGSPLEGHPTVRFPFVEAATGSLGQGLSVGVGMALNARYLDKLPYRTYVLLGDSEMAEGSQWESIELAAHYRLGNLTGILDVNRLGQRGETMFGWDVQAYEKRISSFGWKTCIVDGHAIPEILGVYEESLTQTDQPFMVIAKTIKGKGVSFIENKEGWHGKALNHEECGRALAEIGPVDTSDTGVITPPDDIRPPVEPARPVAPPNYPDEKPVATRLAYGNALARIFPAYPQLISLDGEVSNSTYAEVFQKACPERFFEMFIAEQNMVGAALGLSRRGKIPFVSTFAAFMSRACDQIRMAQYSDANIKFVGSHAGVSIGEDGPSQMGLEDLAFFRTVLDGVVLYPCDAISTERLVEACAAHQGITYLRTTRPATPIVYQWSDEFPIGGSKVLRKSDRDRATVIGAGITVFQALSAYEELLKEDIPVRVVDLYSIKPIDRASLLEAARSTPFMVTVEDHYAEGGLGEAVRTALEGEPASIHSLAVRKRPMSGKPEELLDYEEISAKAIVKKVKEIVNAEKSGRKARPRKK